MFQNTANDEIVGPQAIRALIAQELRYIRTLKVFSKWLNEEGLTKTDVLARLKRLKLPEKVIEVLSDGEINTILECINPDTYIGSRNYAIVVLLLDTGLRASELCGLKIANTDFSDNRLKVLGKGNKERFVPLGVRAKKSLMVYLSRFRPNDPAMMRYSCRKTAGR